MHNAYSDFAFHLYLPICTALRGAIPAFAQTKAKGCQQSIPQQCPQYKLPSFTIKSSSASLTFDQSNYLKETTVDGETTCHFLIQFVMGSANNHVMQVGTSLFTDKVVTFD